MVCTCHWNFHILWSAWVDLRSKHLLRVPPASEELLVLSAVLGCCSSNKAPSGLMDYWKCTRKGNHIEIMLGTWMDTQFMHAHYAITRLLWCLRHSLVLGPLIPITNTTTGYWSFKGWPREAMHVLEKEDIWSLRPAPNCKLHVKPTSLPTLRVLCTWVPSLYWVLLFTASNVVKVFPFGGVQAFFISLLVYFSNPFPHFV